MKTPINYLTRIRYAFGDVKTQSFYRRQIPPHLITFASPEGKQIFRESLDQGHCQAFFPWIQQFITQSDVSTCSSSSMAMMLNTLKIDPGVNWKGIWRWYDQSNIKQMNPDSLVEGLTLEEFHNLSQINHVRSMTFSPLLSTLSAPSFPLKQCSLNFFRSWVKSCTSLTDCLMTVNFHRKTVGQTGTGHYSPLAGYNSKRDMVLILDVAKFKYDPYWCSLSLMYESLKPMDNVSNQSRGFIVNRRQLNLKADSPSSLPSSPSDENNLRNRVHSDLQYLFQLLTNKSGHHLLLPLLYDYHTIQLPSLDQILAVQTCYLTSFENQISQLIERLDQQSTLIVTSFMRDSKQNLIKMLLLVVGGKQIYIPKEEKEKRQAWLELKEFVELLRKYRLSPKRP